MRVTNCNPLDKLVIHESKLLSINKWEVFLIIEFQLLEEMLELGNHHFGKQDSKKKKKLSQETSMKAKISR